MSAFVESARVTIFAGESRQKASLCADSAGEVFLFRHKFFESIESWGSSDGTDATRGVATKRVLGVTATANHRPKAGGASLEQGPIKPLDGGAKPSLSSQSTHRVCSSVCVEQPAFNRQVVGSNPHLTHEPLRTLHAGRSIRSLPVLNSMDC